MKIVIWARIGSEAIAAALASDPALDVHSVDDRDGFAAAVYDADVVCLPDMVVDDVVAALLRERAPSLRLVQLLTTGHERLSRAGVGPKVEVANVGSLFSDAVAEHALSLLLALAKGLPTAVALQRDRSWSRAALEPSMHVLYGKTLLIVGFGSIGHAFARRLQGLGMTVLAIARAPRPSPWARQVLPPEALPTTLGRVDAVVLALPHLAGDPPLFDRTMLARCRPGTLLVNIARGGLVDNDALADALRQGNLGGAAIDVVDGEPLGSEHPLWHVPNLLITPHVAGMGDREGLARLGALVRENLQRLAAGERPLNLIVPDARVSPDAAASRPKTATHLYMVVYTHRRPVHEVDQYLQDHFAFLDRAYADGIYLLSGRREPRNGAVILARAADRPALEDFLAEDPFILHGVAGYEIVEFVPGRASPAFAELIAT